MLGRAGMRGFGEMKGGGGRLAGLGERGGDVEV